MSGANQIVHKPAQVCTGHTSVNEVSSQINPAEVTRKKHSAAIAHKAAPAKKSRRDIFMRGKCAAAGAAGLRACAPRFRARFARFRFFCLMRGKVCNGCGGRVL